MMQPIQQIQSFDFPFSLIYSSRAPTTLLVMVQVLFHGKHFDRITISLASIHHSHALRVIEDCPTLHTAVNLVSVIWRLTLDHVVFLLLLFLLAVDNVIFIVVIFVVITGGEESNSMMRFVSRQ